MKRSQIDGESDFFGSDAVVAEAPGVDGVVEAAVESRGSVFRRSEQINKL